MFTVPAYLFCLLPLFIVDITDRNAFPSGGDVLEHIATRIQQLSEGRISG